MKTVLFLLLTTILFVACGKDKFTTIPQVKIRSISPENVIQGNIIQVKGKFTDQEGDVDSVFIVYKWYDGGTVTRRFDTLKYGIATFGLPKSTREGDLTVEFAYGRQIDGYPTLAGTPVTKDTSATLGLLLKDKVANRSEYVESERIRLRKP